jgi:uncharacterized protein (TIGR02145 family)
MKGVYMNRVLILVTGLFLVLIMISCGVEDEDVGDTGDNSAIDTDMVDDSDNGNTGDDVDTIITYKPCTDEDFFCHSHGGLNWSDASSSIMHWFAATTYCENLGGRLPTISELRTLIQNCPGTETGGACKVTDKCLSEDDCWSMNCSGCEYDSSGKYSVFGDTGFFWSSSEQSDDASYVWHVSFDGGHVGHSYRNYGPNDYDSVRCVR